jgi:FKBP-type peptidyl-prolyl cis-trans isomerase SlpA
MVQWVARKLLVQMGDPTSSTTSATWCSSPRPTAWAATPARCSRSAGDGQPDAVLFDFNHPLAGQPVTFEVHLIGVL